VAKDKFLQSTWPILRVAHLYHVENKQIREISEITRLSPSTITRLLQRATKIGVVKVVIDDVLLHCINISKAISEKYKLRFTVVIPLSHFNIRPDELEKRYKDLALEGARYLQHIIKHEDVLGIGCNWMLRELAGFLNPCFKINAKFVAMSNMLLLNDNNLNIETFVAQFAKVFGHNNSFPHFNGLADGEAQMEEWIQRTDVQLHLEWYRRITVSIANVQCMFAEEHPMPILRKNLHPWELQELHEKGACGEFLLRFFDRAGNEIDSAVRRRTFAIDYDTYKRIPTKIVLAAGDTIARALDVFLEQGMADILIMDEYTAEELLRV